MSSLENYIWKKDRYGTEQDECRLIDMSQEELQKAYDHCKHMLYNSDSKNPGRMVILDKIDEQIRDCNAELALRWLKSITDSDGKFINSDISILIDLRELLKNKSLSLNTKYSEIAEIPTDYKNVTIEQLINHARDIKYFDYSKITLAFIYRLGIYFTPKELDEMNYFTVGHTINEKFDVLKAQLGLADDIVLHSDPNGLSENEFRDMIHLKKMKGYNRCKYSKLTTGQLKTLQQKVLYALEEEIIKQINVWKTLMEQIEEVANFKQYIIK